MNKIKIYANYGMLAHEKEIMYDSNSADISDYIEITLPNGFSSFYNDFGHVMLQAPTNLGGETYSVSEIVTDIYGNPHLQLFDNGKFWTSPPLEYIKIDG